MNEMNMIYLTLTNFIDKLSPNHFLCYFEFADSSMGNDNGDKICEGHDFYIRFAH